MTFVEIVQEIDIWPGVRGPVVDHAGHLVSRLLHDTPFRPGAMFGQVRAGLCRVTDMQDCRYWRLQVDPRATWSDGAPVTAAQVGSAIVHAGWQDDVAGRLSQRLVVSELSGDALAVVTEQASPWLPFLLSSPCFAPRRRRATSGPYRFEGSAGDRHRFWRRRDGRFASCDRADVLVLRRTDDPWHGRRLLDQGKIDVTCPTTHPPEVAQHAQLRAPLSVVMALAPGAAVSGPGPGAVCELIDAIVDRRELSEVTRGITVALQSWTELHTPPELRGSASSRDPDPSTVAALRDALGTRPLHIGFADFVPNFHVAQTLAVRLETVLRIPVRPRRLSYKRYLEHAPQDINDWLLVLSVPTFPHVASMGLVPRDASVGVEVDGDVDSDQTIQHLLPSVAEPATAFRRQVVLQQVVGHLNYATHVRHVTMDVDGTVHYVR